MTEDEFRRGPAVAAPNYPSPELKPLAVGQPRSSIISPDEARATLMLPKPDFDAAASHVAADGAAMAVPYDSINYAYQFKNAGPAPMGFGYGYQPEPSDWSLKARFMNIPLMADDGTPNFSMTDQAQHVFAGEPDARQSDRVDHKVSRFRPTYRALTPEQKALHDRIKELAAVLEAAIEQTPPGYYQSLAMTALEEAVIWAVKGLTQ